MGLPFNRYHVRRGGSGGGGGHTYVEHGCSRLAVDICLPAPPGWSTLGFRRPGRRCLCQALGDREVLGRVV